MSKHDPEMLNRAFQVIQKELSQIGYSFVKADHALEVKASMELISRALKDAYDPEENDASGPESSSNNSEAVVKQTPKEE